MRQASLSEPVPTVTTGPLAAPHEAAPPAFPIPHVPKNPVLGWASFAGRLADRDAARFPSVLALPHQQFVTSARVAIALALQRLEVGPGDRVLVPAYHCLSMVEPVVFTGALPTFFALDPALRVSLPALEASDLSRVKAMIVTHYFGFPQAMAPIRAFAERHGIRIVEDCAHAIFGFADGAPIGSWGDYAAVSLMKFYPVYDGGSLVSAHHDLSDLSLKRPSTRFEGKALFNSFERGLHYGRFPGVHTAARFALSFKDSAWARVKRLRARGGRAPAYHDPAASEGINGLDPSWLDRRISVVSRRLVDLLPAGRIVHRRREHYRRFLSALTTLPGATALFPTLPDSVVPYVFPLRIDRPERVFRRLKEDGVPLFRWERLWGDDAARIDPVAARYATEIFQLPCHQELTDDDVDWMIDRIRVAFAAA